MAYLSNLEDATEVKLDCLTIKNQSEIDIVLRHHYAATAAGLNGAINVWKDKNYYYRCERMRFMRTEDKQKFETIQEAKKWVKNALKIIN